MIQKVNIGCKKKFPINIQYDNASARYIGEVLEHEEYKFVLPYLKEEMTIVDVGANIGTFSFYVYDVAKKIIAFEPAQESYELMRGTIKDNNLTKIELHHEAVSGSTGEGQFAAGSNPTAGAGFLDPKGTRTVKTRSLNDLGLDHIDLLKIDTEGGEVDIMSNTDFEKLRVEVIVGEFHAGGKASKYTFNSIVGSKGFSPKDIDGLHFIATHL